MQVWIDIHLHHQFPESAEKRHKNENLIEKF